MSSPIRHGDAADLLAVTVQYRDAKETFERHRDRWHEAIVALVDAGATPRQVADLVQVAPQRINAIIARVYSR